jgi:hypothetical protein
MAGDPFEELAGATPVTSDDADSVESEQSNSAEAEALRRKRSSSGREVDSDVDTAAGTSPGGPWSKWVAQCRYCRRGFEDRQDAVDHEGHCQSEPVAECVYCEHPHTRRSDPEAHLYSCDAFQRERRNERAHAYRGDGEPVDPETGYFIDPQPHEFGAYLKYDCSDLRNPLRTYFGLNSLQKEHDFTDHGRLRTGIEIDGQEYAVAFQFKGSGIEPRDRASFTLEEVKEYLVYVYPAAYTSYEDAKAEDRKRAYFKLSPRWPDIESVEGAAPMSNPHDIEGFDVEVDGSYFDFDRYPDVLYEALSALSARQGFRFDSYTSIRAEDLAPEAVHESSNVVDAELYVRVAKGETGKMIAYDGPLHRLSLLLAGDRDGYAKTVRDDRECPGWYHTATLAPRRCAEAIGGHQLPKEWKHYHVRNPDAVTGTELENPKVGVSFQHSLADATLHYHDLDRLERELDEALLNLLQWSDLPTRPDGQYYVADDYFSVTGSRRFRKTLPDRLPDIESDQDDAIFAVASQATPTDLDLVDTLLSDGGEWSPAGLADAIGVHLDTVYRALDRLGPLVDHQYGDVQLASQYIAQELSGYIDRAREAAAEGVESLLDGLLRGERFGGDGDDPWTLWRKRYGAEVRETAGANPDLLDVGFKPVDFREARRLLAIGAANWAEVTGEPIRRFGFEYQPEIETVDGKTYAPKHFADALGKAG